MCIIVTTKYANCAHDETTLLRRCSAARKRLNVQQCELKEASITIEQVPGRCNECFDAESVASFLRRVHPDEASKARLEQTQEETRVETDKYLATFEMKERMTKEQKRIRILIEDADRHPVERAHTKYQVGQVALFKAQEFAKNFREFEGDGIVHDTIDPQCLHLRRAGDGVTENVHQAYARRLEQESQVQELKDRAEFGEPDAGEEWGSTLQQTLL